MIKKVIARQEEIKKQLKSTEIEKHLKKADDYLKKNFFEEALTEYENYKFLKPDSGSTVQGKIEELVYKINPIKRAAKMAMDVGNKCIQKGKYEEAITAFKRCMVLDDNETVNKQASQKIAECAKLKGKTVSGFAKKD